MKIRSLNVPEPLGPPRPVAGHLYLYYYTVTLLYYQTVILLYYYTIILLYYYTIILLHCYTSGVLVWAYKCDTSEKKKDQQIFISILVKLRQYRALYLNNNTTLPD